MIKHQRCWPLPLLWPGWVPSRLWKRRLQDRPWQGQPPTSPPGRGKGRPSPLTLSSLGAAPLVAGSFWRFCRTTLSLFLLLALSACLVPEPPEVRGWACDSDTDCMKGNSCHEGFCRGQCRENIDCLQATGEYCASAGVCLPQKGWCKPGQEKDCYTGPANTDQKGSCQRGRQICNSDSTWGSCVGEILPQKETCNNQDDDCDGHIDNGVICECKPKSSRFCYTGKKGCVKTGNDYYCTGSCKKGTQRCTANHRWGPCEGEVLPSAQETCNGQDDDCNGDIDDNIAQIGKPCTVQGQKGECAKGIAECNKGKFLCRSQIENPPTQESKCDKLDEDCDGKTDEDPGICPSGTRCIQGTCK